MQDLKRLTSKRAFEKIVRELVSKHFHDLRLKKDALKILHEASEFYIIEIFEIAQMNCQWRKSTQISMQDFRHAVLLVNRTMNLL